MSSAFDLVSLANLLHECDPDRQDVADSEDSDDNADKLPAVNKTGPGDIGLKSELSNSEQSKVCKKEKVVKQTTRKMASQIWSTDEVSKTKVSEAQRSCIQPPLPPPSDSRKTPTYRMHYRQSVTPEDVFLQMGYKTPSSASCENLIVEIDLPDEEDGCRNQLNVGEQTLDIRGPIYLLHLGLPHPVDTKAGNAKWMPEKKMLVVTLKLKRELDKINFW